MELFLKILGGVVLCVILLVVSFYLYIRFKLGKYYNYTHQREPFIVHLTEDVGPEWLEEKCAKQIDQDMVGLGFERGKAYFIPEMQNIELQSYIHGKIVAVLYQHPIAGLWVDMCVEEVGGNEYTVSNAPMGSGLDKRPECIKFFDKKADVGALYQKISEIITNSDKEMIEFSIGDFRHYFEEAYKKEAAWKARKGGISREEFMTIYENDANYKLDDKQIEEAFVESKRLEIHDWADAAIEDYAEKSDKKPDEIDEMGTLIIVPFTTNNESFLRYLEDVELVTEEQLSKLIKKYTGDIHIENLFNEVNELLSPQMRAEFVCDLSFPLPLKLYRKKERYEVH